MNDPKSTPKTEAQLLPLAEAGDMNAALELAKLYLDTHNPALYRWAKTLCAGGKPEGYYLLGKCYQFGIAVESDHAEAERLYRQSAQMGLPRALTGIVSLLIADPEKRGANTPETVRLLKQAVAQGDEKAMYVLSNFYKGGAGVARSPRKQYELLYRSAELGYVPAMTALGELCLEEPESRDHGIEWLQKAVEHGDATAQTMLDKLNQGDSDDVDDRQKAHEDGPGSGEFLEELKKESINSLQCRDQMIADAEAGVPEAQYMLGDAYWRGNTMDGIPFDADLDKAREWLGKAAKQGHDMASFTLGLIAEQEDDYATAISWYLRAANNGLKEAVTNLGVAYAMTAQDDKAVLWLRKGADMGDAMAMSRLATLYAQGRGVAADIDEAIRLYRASAKAGDRYGCLCMAKLCLTTEHLNVPAAESALIKLANAGETQAQTMLAQIYLGSHGQDFVDYAIAEDLLWDAADQDDIEAYYLLGIFYYYIAHDKEWAYKTLSHAAANGSHAAMRVLHDLFGVN